MIFIAFQEFYKTPQVQMNVIRSLPNKKANFVAFNCAYNAKTHHYIIIVSGIVEKTL